MKILTAEQLRSVDAMTITMEPIRSVDLMERAAAACFHWIQENITPPDVFLIFCGPGNNGGDGLAIARMLVQVGHSVNVFMLAKPEKYSLDSRINFDRFQAIQKFTSLYFLEDKPDFLQTTSRTIIVDALYGTGIARPLKGLAADTVQQINQMNATVIAIDIPSGLFSEKNDLDEAHPIVKADITLTFQMPKLSFMFAENEKYTGEWHQLDIQLHPAVLDLQKTNYAYIQPPMIQERHKHRKKFSHKGTFGHALLFAGNYGHMGAAVLSSQACLRGGVGLLTTHIVQKGFEIMQIAVPEAMVSIDSSIESLATIPDMKPYNAVGIGPGIGTEAITAIMFHQLLLNITKPMVIDADGLNLLAAHPNWLSLLHPETILTPHPGEFDRLAGKHTSGWERHLSQIKLSRQYKLVIILKGAYTSITDSAGNCWFNSTGNPGMATAGSGDVLTGITLSLLAQGYPSIDAAIIAVYIHGLAGDIAKTALGEEAIIASDIIKNIGSAFKTITNYQSL